MSRLAIVAALCVLALSGCSIKPLKPEPLTPASLTPSDGVLIGSFSRNPRGYRYTTQSFYFKNADTNEEHELRSQHKFDLISKSTQDEFREVNNAGATFALKLPAGRYILRNFRLHASTGNGYVNYSSKTDFAIPFEVKANSVNYLGELKLESTTGKNFFGMPVPTGGIWIVSDKQDRDLALVRAAMPQMPSAPVISVVPTKKDIFTPLVVLPNEQPAKP